MKEPGGSGKVFVSAGLAACASEFATLPLDTAKVRLQLQSLSETYKPRKYRGVSHAMRLMVRQEGLGSLWNGLIPGLHRQALFTTIRLGLYDTLKVHAAAEGGGGEATLGGRVSLAVLTSALGIAAANPSDVLKVRCQAHGLRGGAMRNYRHIVSTEGLRGGLYKGFTANLIRNSVISASEIISYEQAKKTLIRVGGVADDWRLHLASGCIAGLVATVLGSPPDILATKAMQKQGRYGGLRASEIAVKMVKTEGFLAFYKGKPPSSGCIDYRLTPAS